MPIYKKVNKKFFKKWTPEMAYILGFFAADGSIVVNPRGSHYITLQITDGDLVKKIKDELGSDHKIKRRKRNRKWNDVFRIQIGSKEMCNDLRKLGFSERKTHNMVVPEVPDKFFSDFLRGYFDGDGSVWVGYVHKDRTKPLLVIRVVFTSCSGKFLETLKLRLEENRIKNGVLRKERGNYFRLTYSIHGSLKLYNFMYNRICRDLFLERKKTIFDSYIQKRMRL